MDYVKTLGEILKHGLLSKKIWLQPLNPVLYNNSNCVIIKKQVEKTESIIRDLALKNNIPVYGSFFKQFQDCDYEDHKHLKRKVLKTEFTNLISTFNLQIN